MSGILGVLLAGSGNYFSVTVVDVGSSGVIFGYNDSATPGGSISPTSYRGISIKVVGHDTQDPDTFGITLQGSRAQALFGGVEIQKTDGSSVILYTADASFSDLTTITIWQWDTDAVWTADTPSPRFIRIF